MLISFCKITFRINLLKTKKLLMAATGPYIYLTDRQAEEVAGIFETILLEKQVEHHNKYELIALKIIELLIFSERLFEDELGLPTNTASKDTLKRFIELLDVHFSKEHSVKFYAEQLLIHPK